MVLDGAGRDDDGADVPAEGPLAVLALGWLAFRSLNRVLWWRRHGMVLLRYGRRTWRWVTPTRRGAYVAAGLLATTIETGAWIPGRTPPPPIEGAEDYPY